MLSLRNSAISRLGTLATCFVLAAAVASTGSTKRPIKKPTYDPQAAEVELFDGIEEGQLDALLIPRNSLTGNVFIENKTDKPLTVKLPRAVVGVQVLKQGFGGGGMGAGGMGGGQQGGGGQNQQSGGGFGGGGGGQLGGGQMGGGGGFFSVPPERTVQLTLTSVCLNHGKKEPSARLTYKLVRVESYTKDPVLQEVLAMVGTGRLDSQSAQAATWHLTDGMSWNDLANKKVNHVGGVPDSPYFTRQELLFAQQIIAQAQAVTRDRKPETTEKKL